MIQYRNCALLSTGGGDNITNHNIAFRNNNY